MANVMLKSLKFTKILNGRLSFSSAKTYINGQYIVRSYKQTRQTKAYATAAYKLAPNEDLDVKNSITTSNAIKIDVDSIDRALSKIDSLIRRNGRTQLKNVHQIFSSITCKEMTTSTQGLYLIRCCKFCYDEPPSKRIELVNQIWNRYQELGLEFDVRHYNSLLDVHISNGFKFDPAEILASMEDLNIEPNKVTYMLIMKKYCQDGNINGASEILEYMKEKGLSADEKVFNYLIEGHIKNNDIPGAKDMIEVMRSSNLQPTADTHIILACGYAATGEINEMMSCLKECGQKCSVQNYLKVVDVLATSGNHQHIDDVLSLIPKEVGYEQEFINATVELIHKGHVDTAYKLAIAACSPEFCESVHIFMKQLIKLEKPVSEVISFCERIFNEGHSKSIFVIASKVTTESGKLDYAIPIFKKLLENGNYIRPSNFWPLFTSIKEPEGPWLILKEMSKLGIPADFTTYCDFLYPTLGLPNPDLVLQNVKRSGQTIDIAADALLLYYCNLGNIDYAVQLTEIYPVKISNKLDTVDFVERFTNLSKESLSKYLKLLKYMLMEVDSFHVPEIQGKLLAALIMKKTNILEAVINKFEDFVISESVLSVCEQELLQKNPARIALLKKLRNVSLERGTIFKQRNISVEDENKHISYLQAQNMSCKPFLTKRILHHIREMNIARVSELVALFDELQLTYTPMMLTNLMYIYCVVGDIEKATEAANKLKTEFSSFKPDLARYLEYVNLLIKYEKFDESLEAMNNLVQGQYIYVNKDMVVKNAKKLKLTLVSIPDVEFVKKMQNLLLPLSKEFGFKTLCMEVIIHYHLQRNDLKSAFEEFKNIMATHRIPVFVNLLLRKCISMDDRNTLQKVIDLTINSAGKSYASLELAIAFIETFNIQKAARVIENLGQETDPKILDDICLKLSDQNKISVLEQLLHITKCLNHVDRENLYCYAFRAYANNKDFEKAMKLFEILKQEVTEPNSQTIKFVQDLFENNNQPLPLSQISKSSEPSPLASEATKPFIEHLEAGNAEEALKELNTLKKGYIRALPVKILTDLVDLCLQKNCVMDLSLNVQAMTYIMDNVKDVYKPLLEKYSETGDIEKFIVISSFMPDFSLIKIGFNTYFCNAFISSGKHEDLLLQLEQRTDKKNKLFSVTAFEELIKLPEYEDRLFNLATKYFDSNYFLPMAVIWACYFSKENFEKADEIHKKYSVPVERVDNIILKKIRESENVNLARRYVDFVTQSNVRQRLQERAYGVALDLLVMKGMYDEAVALVVESEKQNLLLHKYYVSTLVTLKNALEKENKPVPFSIPLDASSISSLDSA